MSDDDDATFRELGSRMRSVADGLAATHQAIPGEAAETAAPRRQCIIRLTGNLGNVEARFDDLGVLVGSAAKSSGPADLALTRALSAEASGFLEQLKFHRQILNLTIRQCASEGAAAAKGEEISRLYADAASLVQSILRKMGASNLSR